MKLLRLPRFSPITAYMRDVLHWLPISQRIQYCITALVSRFVLSCAPSFLRDLCCPMSVLAARWVLRSAARVSYWSLGHVWLLCSEGPLRLWAHRFGIISLLSCVPC